MDHQGLLACPIQDVFGHLADPARLGDWLPGAAGIHAPDGAAAFTLRLSRDGTKTEATGELIAYEPPWQLAYWLRAGPDTHVLRITCTAAGAGTRVHVRQAGPARPLAVDLARLGQALTTRPPPGPAAPGRPGPGPGRPGGTGIPHQDQDQDQPGQS